MKILAKGLDFYGLLHNDFQFCQLKPGRVLFAESGGIPRAKAVAAPGGNTEAFAGRHLEQTAQCLQSYVDEDIRVELITQLDDATLYPGK